MRLAYRRIRSLVTFLARLLAHVEIEGLEHVPASGPFLLVVNHISRLDPPILMMAMPHQIYVLAASEYRRVPILKQLMEASGAIWVRRGELDLAALRAALAVLKRGDVLGMAPEGTRSRTRALQPARPGAAYIALRSGVPVVPAAITGTEKMLEDFLHLRRMRIRVVIGEPFRLPVNEHPRSEALQAATEQIMRAIAVLLPPAYQGVYALDRPVAPAMAEALRSEQ